MTGSRITQNAFTTPVTDVTQTWQSHAAKFTVHWGRAGAVVTASGEIDAANAGPFAHQIKQCADCCEWLVLDLSALTFIGTLGCAALHSISAQCAREQMSLMVIPGLPVSTVLRICDPESRVPLAGSLAIALANVQKSGRPLRAVR